MTKEELSRFLFGDTGPTPGVERQYMQHAWLSGTLGRPCPWSGEIQRVSDCTCPKPDDEGEAMTEHEDLTVVVRIKRGLVPEARRGEIKEAAAQGALQAILDRLEGEPEHRR